MGKGQVKTLSKLKLAGQIAFILTGLAGASLCIAGLVKTSAIKDDIKWQYTETEVYQRYADEQLSDIQTREDNGELTEEQAAKEREGLDSWKFITNSKLKDDLDNAQYQKNA